MGSQASLDGDRPRHRPPVRPGGAAAPLVLSVDPGLSGALALLDGDGVVLLDDLPLHRTQHGRGGKVRVELDVHGLRDLLAGHRIGHVFIERVSARPGQGTVSMFRFGQAVGAIYGVVVTLQLPVTFVAPRTWQGFHRIGPASGAAVQRACELLPGLASQLTRKRDCHKADAVLIGAYGLSTLHTLQPEAAKPAAMQLLASV